MAATKVSMLASLKTIEDGLLKAQRDLHDAVTNAGISAADEAEVDAELVRVSTLANPVVPNPDPLPPDPGGTVPEAIP